MKRILILFVFIFLVGCAGTKKVVTKTREKVKTLTTISEVKLDTIIFIPGEKVSITIPIENATIKGNESPKVFTQKKGKATVTVKIDSTGITAIANCDSIVKKLNYYKKLTKQLETKVKNTAVTETIKKGYNLFDLILYITAFSIVSFVAGYLIKKLKII